MKYKPVTRSTALPPERLTELEWMRAMNIGRECKVPQEVRDSIQRAKDGKHGA